MADQITKGETGFLLKLGQFIKQSPLLAVCIWMGWRDIQREAKQEVKDQKQEQRETEREKFEREQLIYYRDAKQEELRLKEKELKMKYEKDTLH